MEREYLIETGQLVFKHIGGGGPRKTPPTIDIDKLTPAQKKKRVPFAKKHLKSFTAEDWKRV